MIENAHLSEPLRWQFHYVDRKDRTNPVRNSSVRGLIGRKMSTAATPARLMTDIDASAHVPADINRLRAGDSAAVAAFVRNHEPAMRRLVGRITVWSDETDDIVQDVFATALVALPKFRGECEIETWLTRIAINRCRRHLRRKRLARAFFGRRSQREAPRDERDRTPGDRGPAIEIPRGHRVAISGRTTREGDRDNLGRAREYGGCAIAPGARHAGKVAGALDGRMTSWGLS